MKRLCQVLATALLLCALAATPAAADDDWILDALDTVLEETILLTEAGAFGPDPVLQAFVDEYGWGFTPEERAELLDELYWYDDYGVDSTSTAPANLSPEAIGALQLLDASTRSILDANSETAFLDHEPYLDAISDLLIRRGEAPVGARDPAERDILEVFIVDFANADYFQLYPYARTAARSNNHRSPDHRGLNDLGPDHSRHDGNNSRSDHRDHGADHSS